MNIARNAILAAGCLLAAMTANGAEQQPRNRKIGYEIGLGFNIGAMSPLGLPAERRKIDSYQPKANLSIDFAVSYMLSDKWGIGAGLCFETKGMKTGVEVKDYHLKMNIEEGDEQGTRTGYFTGRIKNDTRVTYITIPVNAVFRPDNDWKVEAGPYFSIAIDRSFLGDVSSGKMRETPLHPAIGISKASYDYSDDIRHFDFGIGLGGSRRIYRGLSVRADLKWGLLTVLDPSKRTIDMDTYNIYLNLGLSYAF